MSRVAYPVRVVGTGLLGTSIALGLRCHGVTVTLADASPTNVALAVDLGAGQAAGTPTDPVPGLIVVAVPPDVTAQVAATELTAHPTAVVTDIASVKAPILDALRATGADLTRYVGSHPMAGRERGGPLAARADLFQGRPWVVCHHSEATSEATRMLDDLALDLGASLVTLPAAEHDAAVALVSHVPHLLSALMARRLVDGSDEALALAGPGVRDVTRVAASAPDLWVQILSANAGPVRDILIAARDDLGALVEALDHPTAPGARHALAAYLAGGNAGTERLPGKHGTRKAFTSIVVAVDDRPGELARLLTEIGEIGVNLEDVRLEHAPGRLVGLAEIAVVPETAAGLRDALAARDWRVVG